MSFDKTIDGSGVRLFGASFELDIRDTRTIIKTFIFKSSSRIFFNVQTSTKPVVINSLSITRYTFSRNIQDGDQGGEGVIATPEAVAAANRGLCTIGSIFVNGNYLADVISVIRNA